MANQLPGWYTAVPPFRRMMIFIDGENLVFRYQAMLAKGWVPRQDEVTHIEDVVIWCPRFAHGIGLDEVLCATYYTYAIGDELKLKQIRETIKELTFYPHNNSRLPNNLTPQVFKKESKTAKAKGVDIQLTVDILNHVHRNNVDTVMLLSGHGDYIPVVEEVLRCGKQCYISAFSDGLNAKLVEITNRFCCLDNFMFTQ
jgi:uncharacterized LabA/DUF88 family protein